MKPLLLHYYITNRCNSRCSFCEIWKEMPKSDARTADVLANLRDAKKAGCSFVDFTGGEPLLHPELPLFLSEAKALGFVTSITTNCIVFKNRAPALAGKVDLLHFSLDADTEKLHNEIRGADCFASVLESIPIALANNLVPDLLFTYTDRTIDAFKGVYEIAKKNKLIVILDPVFNVDGPDSVSALTHAKALAFAKLPGVYLNKAHLTLRARGGNTVEKPVCKATASTIAILPDNRLALPCYHQARVRIPLGGGLTGVLSGSERREAAALQGRYPFCEGCHINCYFDPSYQRSLNALLYQSTRAKVSYAFTKYILFGRPRPRLRPRRTLAASDERRQQPPL
jgi:MoaA/NifB/PqqE/SkfB family radical SAM enzyme